MKSIDVVFIVLKRLHVSTESPVYFTRALRVFKDLLEQVLQSEGGLAIDLVVRGFLGIAQPAHALLAVAGDKRLLYGALGFARRAGGE